MTPKSNATAAAARSAVNTSGSELREDFESMVGLQKIRVRGEQAFEEEVTRQRAQWRVDLP